MTAKRPKRPERSRAGAPAVDGGLASVVERSSVVVCCGTGGVGKTTTAAALAVGAALAGRRVALVTIDPARRLADALGIASLGNDPERVADEQLRAANATGELWALMLDTALTFDALVARYATDERQRDGILTNRFYRNISARLSGTQEYMAAEKLYQLATDVRFDLVVVDTPPARNALDFLDAPERLTRFLDPRVYRALMGPTRLYLKAVNVATQAVLRPVARLVGAEVIADAMAFFQAFDGMEAGFRERAVAVNRLLRDRRTSDLLVAAPRADAVSEAGWFADRLVALGVTIGGLVVNRTHPRFGALDASAASAAAEAAHAVGHVDIAAWWTTLAELVQVAEDERGQVAALETKVAPAPTVAVPLRATDIHDLRGLVELADVLLPPSRRRGVGPLA